jgi:hypothetical protein
VPFTPLSTVLELWLTFFADTRYLRHCMTLTLTIAISTKHTRLRVAIQYIHGSLGCFVIFCDTYTLRHHRFLSSILMRLYSLPTRVPKRIIFRHNHLESLGPTGSQRVNVDENRMPDPHFQAKFSLSPAAAPHSLFRASITQNKNFSSAARHDRSGEEPHIACIAGIDTLHLYTLGAG